MVCGFVQDAGAGIFAAAGGSAHAAIVGSAAHQIAAVAVAAAVDKPLHAICHRH